LTNKRARRPPRPIGLRHAGGLANLAKLIDEPHPAGLSRDLGPRILGPMGTVHAYDNDSRKALDEATGNPILSMITELALFAPGPSIYGGTDQVQRNIIGERVLGLPSEPRNDKTLPFNELRTSKGAE
jgi:hypothetical protein